MTYVAYRVRQKSITICLLVCWILWGGLMPVSAEMYRWQSEDGGIQYSNVPPSDRTIVPEIMQINKIPLVTDTDGTMYYLAVPQGSDGSPARAQKPYEPLTLPPDVLAQLAQATSIDITTTPQPQDRDIAPFIERLAELERIVQQEIAIRTSGKAAGKEDVDLKLALRQMKAEIEQLQKAVAITDIHISTLKDPSLQFQAIESKVQKVQANADAIARRTEEQLSALQQSVAELTAAQKEQAAAQTQTPQQISQLTSRVEAIQAKTDTLAQHTEQRFASLQQTIENLSLSQQQNPPQEQFQQFDERFNTIQADVDELAQRMKQQFDSLYADLKRTQQSPPVQLKDSQFDEKFNSIRADLDTLSQQMKYQLASLQNTIDEMKQELQAVGTPQSQDKDSQLQTQFGNLENKMNQIYGRFITIEERVSDIDTEAIYQKLGELTQDVLQLQSQLSPENDDSEIQATLNKLQTAHLKQIEELHTQLDALHDFKNMYTKQLRTLSAKMEALGQGQDSGSLATQALSQRLETLAAQVDRLEQANQAGDLQALEQRFESLSAQIRDLEQAANQDTIPQVVEQRLESLSAQIRALEQAAPQNADTQALEERLDILSAKIQNLTTQQTPDYNVRIKLATLETQVEDLIESLSSSRRASQVVEELREANTLLETVIKHQANTLQEQQRRLDILETQYQQLLQILGIQ